MTEMDIGTEPETGGESTDQQMNSFSDMGMADDTNDEQRLFLSTTTYIYLLII